ncbi:Hypothetical_protein [Hexamita inflata]|uniref:Hypothetical_protein n=1 Tax=Hexamita inflata TaxID=28002 RepID=A0AA86U0T6_9EUKA|nr:Hypothetical protein HINF_LOCUS23506 [Hexamita inflata]
MKPHEQQKDNQTQHLDQQSSNQIEFCDLTLNNNKNLTSELEVCNTQIVCDVSRYINHFPKIQQEEGKYYNSYNLPQRNFVNPHINRFQIQQIQNIVFNKVPQDYAQKDVIQTEEMLQVILFESKVQAIKVLKYKTTIRNKLSADNQFACLFNDLHTRDFVQKIQNENNDQELLNIFTQKTNQKNQTEIKRCKNECKRTASVRAIKGATINKTKSRYCHKFEFIVRQSGEINTFQQILNDITYYQVVFQKRKHHVGANPCYYRKCVQITSRMLNMFTEQQSLILLDYNLSQQIYDFLW